MKTKLQTLIGLLVATLLFTTSCEKDNNNIVPTPETGYLNGYYIVNEGPFMNGTGTIDFVDKDGKKYQNIYFTENDGEVLGNLAHSIAIIGSKTYIVVNNDNKIVIVDTKTFKKLGTIDNLPSPRYIIKADDETAFVSCINDNTVKIINLNGFEILGSIPVNGPEKMMKVNEQIWVLSQGGFSVDSSIVVIDAATKAIVDTISVYPQPSGIQQDKNGNIWIMCSGRFSYHQGGNSAAHLLCIHPTNHSIIKDIEFPSADNHPEELEINDTKDMLYYRYPGGICQTGIESSEPEISPFISHANGFYTITYDASNNLIYASDPLDYVQNGWVYSYDAVEGSVIDSLQAGIVPGEIYIVPANIP